MFRRRIDQLTGGTGDVNPQFMNLIVPAGTGGYAVGTASNFQFQLPVQRLQTRGLAQVMEVLKIQCLAEATDMDLDLSSAVTNPIKRITVAARTPAGAGATTLATGAQITDPGVIHQFNLGFIQMTNGANVIASGAGFVMPNKFTAYDEVDLTDGQGHGFLVGTDSLFVQILSLNNVAASAVRLRIFYRQKNVSMAEYVGMVSNQ